MFTGLVERVATVVDVTSGALLDAGAADMAPEDVPADDIAVDGMVPDYAQARRFTFEVADDEYLADVVIGESISVSGVCLTVVEFGPRRFTVQAVEETMRRTTLGRLHTGQPVNLERALRADARLGGHVVQGHIDAVGIITTVRPEGEGWWVTIEPPLELMRYLVQKGSVAIDGISLTVSNVAYSRFSVAIIPHTRAVTTAGRWEPGVQVNIETDIIARYVERFMAWSAAGPPTAIL